MTAEQISAQEKYKQLLSTQDGGVEVDEDMLYYWEIASRWESGEDLTESEIDEMEELRQELGIERRVKIERNLFIALCL